MFSEVTCFIRQVTVIYVTSFVPAISIKVVLAMHVPIILQIHYTASSIRTISAKEPNTLITEFAGELRPQIIFDWWSIWSRITFPWSQINFATDYRQWYSQAFNGATCTLWLELHKTGIYFKTFVNNTQRPHSSWFS